MALKLREIYPVADRARFEEVVSEEFIERFVQRVTEGLEGQVGVVPRHSLRELVHVFDLVDENPSYDPRQVKGFEPHELSAVEGQPEYDPKPDDDKGYKVIMNANRGPPMS